MHRTSSVGSWKQSDFPDAVPVVTTVGPSNASRSACSLMVVQAFDPCLRERAGDPPVEVVGDRDRARRMGRVGVVVDQSVVLAAAAKQFLPGLGFTHGGHG